MLVCPLLFLVPVLFEFVQHVAEIQIGMYVSADAFKLLANDEARQWTGLLKIIGIMLPGYWYVRYLGFNNSVTKARSIESPAIWLWLVILLYGFCFQLPVLFPEEIASLFAIEQQTFMQGFGVFNLAFSILGIYLIGWSIAWPLGNSSIGWLRSIKLMHGHFFRAIVYTLSAVVVFMGIHYGLGYLAMGLAPSVVWILMIIDSFVVGLLALNMFGAAFYAVRRAAEEKGVSLTPASTNPDHQE